MQLGWIDTRGCAHYQVQINQKWRSHNMKTERVTLLISPDFKAFLSAEALREGVSVAELVRSRCERRPSEEEVVLAALTCELNKAVREAKSALKGGLDEAQAVHAELRTKRGNVSAAEIPVASSAPPSRGGRKSARTR